MLPSVRLQPADRVSEVAGLPLVQSPPVDRILPAQGAYGLPAIVRGRGLELRMKAAPTEGSPEDMSRMEWEMEKLAQEFRSVEDSHGRNVLNVVVVAGYKKKLLDNP